MQVPFPPPDYRSIFLDAPDLMPKLFKLKVGPAPGGQYRHWYTLRHVEPPDELTSEQWWAAVKLARVQSYREVPLKDKHGKPFVYGIQDPLLEYLHEIDRQASGNIQATENITNPQTRDRYIVNSLIEEAITSSQLEGASTTSQVARDMIRSGRKPVDRSERMILNNYLGMSQVRSMYKEPITKANVLRLHRILTEGTMDQPDGAGRFRRIDEDIHVSDGTGKRLHEPPRATELEERLDALCSFSNGSNDEQFIHPVVKAIIVHFWFGYDHPFIDGNGRTARALFYWMMLQNGYWLFEYVSISHILRKAPAKYARAFLYTETDDNDLTYFILHQLAVIKRAIIELLGYLERKTAEVHAAERLFAKSKDLNHRQLALLSHALRHPGATYSIDSHRISHSVAYQTARTDLLDLEKRRFLEKTRRGKLYNFTPGTALNQVVARGEAFPR